ncbi:aminotransferase class I/II-fold pyridoxal phosphate-dependent enzyme [Vagococcus sp. BWB3-3]|uniref:cysteine-S-conjugate beta-lyase n=1 Tax=Vagococcus allomyrinae TaxID=2794353 RepID=A0A940SVI9_9ENTE|nr:aminotransferase class I/II-fold pyridoxal phosphate-dependent enzyme [Vagococcus allomyrinae]MBP1042390.1 aminotransferase class I/II-fold pyridoxal phosphate-dependent enzyme [Vagococcus allomyrinae]
MTYTPAYFDKVIERRGTNSGKWDNWQTEGTGQLVAMGIADTDFRPPREVVTAVIERAQHGIFGYGKYGENYRESVMDWHLKRHQIHYQKESIFFTPNVLVALNNVVRALTEEGERIMLFNPTYGPLEQQPLFAKREVVRARLLKKGNRYEIDMAALEELMATEVKLFILCHPHNPTGRVWTEPELKAIVTSCQRHGVLIVFDEIHSDIIMPDQHFIPLMAVARELNYNQNVISLNAPTKTFNSSGLQVAYYIAENPDHVEKINQVRAYSHTTDYIYGNYHYLLQALAAVPQVRVTALEGTYLAWLDVSALNVSEEDLRTRLVTSGVAILSNSDFFEENLFIRVNLATARQTLEKGVAALVQGLS